MLNIAKLALNGALECASKSSSRCRSQVIMFSCWRSLIVYDIRMRIGSSFELKLIWALLVNGSIVLPLFFCYQIERNGLIDFAFSSCN